MAPIRVVLNQILGWTSRSARSAKTRAHQALVVAFSPSGVSHSIAKSIAQATPDEQKEILDRFVDMKQRELATVIVCCALVTTLVATLFSWSWLPVPAYTAKIVGLSALIHSLVAIGIAAQQLVALTRAHIHPHRTVIMQYVLFGTVATQASGPTATFSTGSGWRHFSWQIPTMLLGNSIVLTLITIGIAIFDEARKAGIWGREMVMALCMTVSLIFTIGCYFISWYCIEWQMQEAIAMDY